MPAINLPPTGQKRAFVKQGFDQIAPRYDLLNDLMTGGLHRSWKKEVIKTLQLKPGMRVLDLCSGTGDLAYRAQKMHGNSIEITALDFSWQMMAAGRERDSSTFDWLSADACQLPFADQTYDAAMVGFGLRNVVDLEACLAEVFRVLKPGGRFVNLDTAGAEWPACQWIYQLHMNLVVPVLGRLVAGSQSMYSYLTASAAAFEKPAELESLFQRAGFNNTGHAYRPRGVGGAALVWGEKPR